MVPDVVLSCAVLGILTAIRLWLATGVEGQAPGELLSGSVPNSMVSAGLLKELTQRRYSITEFLWTEGDILLVDCVQYRALVLSVYVSDACRQRGPQIRPDGRAFG